MPATVHYAGWVASCDDCVWESGQYTDSQDADDAAVEHNDYYHSED